MSYSTAGISGGIWCGGKLGVGAEGGALTVRDQHVTADQWSLLFARVMSTDSAAIAQAFRSTSRA